MTKILRNVVPVVAALWLVAAVFVTCALPAWSSSFSGSSGGVSAPARIQASMSASQTNKTQGAAFKVAFNTQDRTTGSGLTFDTTNNKITTANACVMHLDGFVGFIPPTSATEGLDYYYVGYKVNGGTAVIFNLGSYQVGCRNAIPVIIMPISVTAALAAGDYIEIWFNYTSATSSNTGGIDKGLTRLQVAAWPNQ